MENLLAGNGRLLIEACILLGVVLSFFYGYKRGLKGRGPVDTQDEKVKELELRIENLTAANNKYVSFVMKFADAATFLSSNHSFDEAVSSTIRLVEDVLPAEFIGLYIYNRASETLRLTSAFGKEVKASKRAYLMGEGMVGAAAKNKVLLSRETYHDSESTNGSYRPEIAAPILFKDELIGVIGIGGIREPHGDEKRLLAMVGGIAGVSLRNAVFIDDARQEAITDPLTKLYNRRFLYQRATEELVRAKGYSSPVSFFMFDIDNFKHYNDTNGHPEGDRLLVSMTELIRNVTRKTSILARYGGEEFIVLLPNIDKEAAFIYAERVRNLIESTPFPYREKQPLGLVSISGGIAEFPSDGNTLEELIQLADAALYKAKENGRNRIIKAVGSQQSAVGSQQE